MTIDIERKTHPAHHGAPEKPIFRHFRLVVPQGQICAISGPSGIGKSSLLQIVAGLDRDLAGQVAGASAPVGYLFQTPRLLPWRTALENVALVSAGGADEARRWLGLVGLAEAAGVYPARLSVGMARRVALARALAVRPRLLLLDEPFAALDPEAARRVKDLIREEAARLAATVLMVTHARAEAAGLATRLVELRGSPATIASDEPC